MLCSCGLGRRCNVNSRLIATCRLPASLPRYRQAASGPGVGSVTSTQTLLSLGRALVTSLVRSVPKQVLLLSLAFPELILFFEYKWKIEKFLASLGRIRG